MNLALFDFDGTITTGDTFVPFLRFAVKPHRVALGTFLTAPYGLGYRLGLIPARRVRPVVAGIGFRGDSVERVRARGLAYATDVLPTRVQAHALERIRWHRLQGDAVVVVSASLDVYLAPWCEAVGVDLICTTLEAEQGVLTGRYLGGDCSGPTKAERIRARYDVSRFPVVYAYGDSAEDREMLDLAHRRYFRWVETE